MKTDFLNPTTFSLPLKLPSLVLMKTRLDYYRTGYLCRPVVLIKTKAE